MRPTVFGGQVHWPDSALQILFSPTQPHAKSKKIGVRIMHFLVKLKASFVVATLYLKPLLTVTVLYKNLPA